MATLLLCVQSEAGGNGFVQSILVEDPTPELIRLFDTVDGKCFGEPGVREAVEELEDFLDFDCTDSEMRISLACPVERIVTLIV